MVTDYSGSGNSSGIESIGAAEDVELTDLQDGDTIIYNAETAKFENRPSSYVHIQSTIASTWVVTHNMGKYPSVSVVDSGNNIVFGDVSYLSTSKLTITFAAAFSGKAYLN